MKTNAKNRASAAELLGELSNTNSQGKGGIFGFLKKKTSKKSKEATSKKNEPRKCKLSALPSKRRDFRYEEDSERSRLREKKKKTEKRKENLTRKMLEN